MSKQINTRIQNKYDLEVNWNKIQNTFVPREGEVIIYGTEVDENDELITLEDGSSVLPEGRTEPYTYPRIKIGDGVKLLSKLTFISGSQGGIPVEEPTLEGSYKYTGNDIIPSWYNYDPTQLVIGGQTVARDAGTYFVTFSPRKGYCWEDDTTDTKVVEWKIDPISPLIRLDGEVIQNVTLSIDNLEQIFNIEYDGMGVPVIEEKDDISYEDYVEVLITTNKELIIKTKSYTQTEGVKQFTFQITSKGDKNFIDTEYCTVNVTLNFPHEVLNNNSWDVIRKVADAGLGSNIWNIGDVKAIQLDGVVGTVEFEDSTNNIDRYVYIIGFDHNEQYEGRGIHFGGFKQLESDNNYIDYCLTDMYYDKEGPFNSSSSNYKRAFVWKYNDSSAADNWKRASLRYLILGSTNIDNGDPVDYDITDIDNIREYTLLRALPFELRKNMKLMTKYSASTYSAVQTVQEYITLPAACEVCEIGMFPNSGSNQPGSIPLVESVYNKKYNYYENGNSITKYKYNDLNTSCAYFTRTIYKHEIMSYMYNYIPLIYTTPTLGSCGHGFGISPIFVIGSNS